MKITIKLNCDNAAFSPAIDAGSDEAARILREAAGMLQLGGLAVWHRPLRDVNGNRCGTVTITNGAHKLAK